MLYKLFLIQIFRYSPYAKFNEAEEAVFAPPGAPVEGAAKGGVPNEADGTEGGRPPNEQQEQQMEPKEGRPPKEQQCLKKQQGQQQGQRSSDWPHRI